MPVLPSKITSPGKLRSNLDAAVYKQAVPRDRGFPTRSSKTTSTGKLTDNAPEAVEKENPVASVYDRRTLKSRIPRRQPHDYGPNRRLTKPRKTSDGHRPTLPLQIDPANLAGLIDLIATIPFQCSGAVSASHEPATIEDGGPRSMPIKPSIEDRRYIAKDILGHILKKGAQASRLFHPKQAAKMAVPPSFTPKSIRGHSAQILTPPLGDLRAFAGQNSSMAIRSIDSARVQHMLHHLAPGGSMALLLANGSMSPDAPTGPSRKSPCPAVKQKSGLDASDFFN